MHAEPHPGSAHDRRKRKLTSLLVSFALLAISLGCITAQVAFNIVPAGEGTADVKFTYTQELSDDYIEAAKRANVELQQDYAQAGQPAPATLFPESWTEMSEAGGSALPDPNMTITREDERGYTAETSYSVSAGSDTPDFWSLTIGDVDEDGTQRYVFEVSTPKLPEDFDYAEFARNRGAPMPPKPPVVRDDADGGGSGTAGLMGAVQAIMSGAVAELGIEGWYLTRISKEVNLPVYTYKITMPGEITSHTINGQTVGTLAGSGSEFTLVIDDTYLRTFGAGPKWIHIESQVSQCDAQCSAHPNMVWDRSAPGPGCTCICEAGYESDDRGDCVACDQVCAAHDPLAVYDPTDSRPNQCGCACTGDFMEFAWGESDGACRCIVGAERKGNDCVCKSGHEVSTDGKLCVETGDPPKENCPTGTNCLQDPDKCVCPGGTICDPFNDDKDKVTLCSPKTAYVFVSDDVTRRQYLWIKENVWDTADHFTRLGYETIVLRKVDNFILVEHLARPSTRAIAYFGHSLKPALASLTAVQLGNAISQHLLTEYRALGISNNAAQDMSEPANRNLGLDFAYNYSCHSADDMSMRDYLVRSGGIYWGEKGWLFAIQELDAYPKP